MEVFYWYIYTITTKKWLRWETCKNLSESIHFKCNVFVLFDKDVAAKKRNRSQRGKHQQYKTFAITRTLLLFQLSPHHTLNLHLHQSCSHATQSSIVHHTYTYAPRTYFASVSMQTVGTSCLPCGDSWAARVATDVMKPEAWEAALPFAKQ